MQDFSVILSALNYFDNIITTPAWHTYPGLFLRKIAFLDAKILAKLGKAKDVKVTDSTRIK